MFINWVGVYKVILGWLVIDESKIVLNELGRNVMLWSGVLNGICKNICKNR